MNRNDLAKCLGDFTVVSGTGYHQVFGDYAAVVKVLQANGGLPGAIPYCDPYWTFSHCSVSYCPAAEYFLIVDAWGVAARGKA